MKVMVAVRVCVGDGGKGVRVSVGVHWEQSGVGVMVGVEVFLPWLGGGPLRAS